ncbi:MAG TPA: gamma-glutamyl-gamma-aminobutyrate hydrolase family protein [Tepidisphaeraceae bacterium]|nr:gamma-glutamyl-gamma-aminobutyrate hydrolase family protein [Tepidisphaeraceae bacterium]
MPRPVIGITTDYNDRRTQYALPYGYATSIEKAGGLPLLIPYKSDLSLIPQFVDQFDGILFTGGDDLDPATFCEERHPKAEPVDPDREKFEMALLAEVEKRRLPTLGICLGCQLMNVYRGGSLIQFLPDEKSNDPLEHRRFGTDWSGRHSIKLQPDSIISKALGKTDVIANSSHKQAVKTLGKQLRVIATSPDGVIEGIEDPTFPLWTAVQWHPERMHDEADHLALFKMLVGKAEMETKRRRDEETK